MWLTQLLKFRCLSCKLQLNATLRCLISAHLSSFLRVFVNIWAHSPQLCLHHRNHHVNSQADRLFYLFCKQSSRERHHNVPPTLKSVSSPVGFSSCTEPLKWCCCHLMVSYTHSILLKGNSVKHTGRNLYMMKKHLFYCSQCSEVGCQNIYNIQSRCQMTHPNTKIQIQIRPV